MRILSFDIGIKNLAFCDISIYEEVIKEKGDENEKVKENEVQSIVQYDIHMWKVIDISKTESDKDEAIKSKKNDINVTVSQILDALDNLFSQHHAIYDFILLENQPVLKNPIMKSIQIMIFTYFHMKKRSLENTSSNKMGIHLVSASNKNKYIKQLKSQDEVEILQNAERETNSKKGYRYNKRLSHHLCLHFLHHVLNDKGWKDRYMQNKKKDDLADSLLQALQFNETLKENTSKKKK